MKIFVLLIMLFLHIVDDYYLQGVLAKLKKKSWWEEHCPDPLYKNDYIIALIEHAFSWTFMVMLPLMVIIFLTRTFENIYLYLPLFVFNVIAHAWIDHLKANVKNESLLVDQAIHIAQVFGTWAFATNIINEIGV